MDLKRLTRELPRIARVDRQQNLFWQTRSGPREVQAGVTRGVNVFHFDLSGLFAGEQESFGDFLA